MNEPVTEEGLKVVLSNYPTKEDLKVALSNCPTKQDLKEELSHLEDRMDIKMDVKFKINFDNFRREIMDDVRTILFEALELQTIKFEKILSAQIERIDKRLDQNSIEHNKFDARIHTLETKIA